MTSDLYNGVGYYSGSIDTIAPYLTTDTTPTQYLYTILMQRKNAVLPGPNLDAFFAQFTQANPIPKNIDDFAQSFAQFYNLQIVYGSVGAAAAQIKADIINSSKAAIQTNPNSFGSFGPQDADYDPLIDPIGTQISPGVSTINDDIATRSFNDFLTKFRYDSLNQVTSAQFQSNWGNYYLTIANVRDDYRYIFEAFFANNTQQTVIPILNTLYQVLLKILCIQVQEVVLLSYPDKTIVTGLSRSSKNMQNLFMEQELLYKLL